MIGLIEGLTKMLAIHKNVSDAFLTKMFKSLTSIRKLKETVSTLKLSIFKNVQTIGVFCYPQF